MEGTFVDVAGHHHTDKYFYAEGDYGERDAQTRESDGALAEPTPSGLAGMGKAPKYMDSPVSTKSTECNTLNGASDKASDKASDMVSDTDAYLSLTFWDPDRGSLEEAKCRYRPLGINFGKKVPMTVKSLEADSSARDTGVQKGWQLMKINNEDVSGAKFEHIVARLKEETKPLRVVGSARKRTTSRGSSRSGSRSARS
jgi:hypothetical protein